MKFADFKKYAQEGNLIPVYREQLADLETPVSVLSRFTEDENVFLLESVEGGERFGRYSFIGINPSAVFVVRKGKAYIQNADGEKLVGDGVTALREIMKKYRAIQLPELPPLFGGAVGYFSYETVNTFETLPEPKADLPYPEVRLLLVDDMIIFDNLRHTIKIVACAKTDDFNNLQEAFDDANARIDRICALLEKPFKPESGVAEEAPALVSNMTSPEFCAMVKKAKELIVAGEVIQVVLSQKFSAPSQVPPLRLYRALRLINPSPYTFFLKTGNLVLIGSSPETMVKLEDGKSSLLPIAGTRKRGATPNKDRMLADELLNDGKERAEHLMLVDLGRNDLGKVAVPGSVQVKSFMNVERYSHVMHLVSDVSAQLAEGCDAIDLLKATFPAGTLSGAPKIRAMEIIHDLEKIPRGVYGGAVGYFSYTGNLDLAITIRTLEVLDGKISIQAGAGIVYDSIPEKEYEETLNKAAAMFKAVKLAANGLDIANDMESEK